jgi:adenylate kinase
LCSFAQRQIMSKIRIHDRQFSPYYSKDKIADAVCLLAKKLKTDLKHEIPLFLAILNGSFIFAADFLRAFDGPCDVSFIKLASYQNTKSSGNVQELIGMNEDLDGRTVVILEDIIDTGTTLQKIYDLLKEKPVKKIKVAALFFKPDVYKKELHLDYVGFPIPDEFIVGYGLDYNGLGRNLSSIYKLVN